MLAVFRSRTETLNFASLLRSYGVNCAVVNTPRKINVSCGISVQFSTRDLPIVKQILSRRRFDTFAGIYWYKLIILFI